MKKFLNHLFLYASLLFVLIWALGFCAFVLYALSFKFAPCTPTDAIVVLTGGTDRIDTAIDLLKQRDDAYMLISGVNKSVSPAELFKNKNADAEQLNKITLGYAAENTKENAEEIAAWLRNKNIHSILLVTSFYHMPRSIFEAFNSAPHIQIVPYPVFPKSFGDSVDWIRTRYAWLLFLEYHKFLFVHLKAFCMKG